MIRVHLRPLAVPHTPMRCPRMSHGMDAVLPLQRVP